MDKCKEFPMLHGNHRYNMAVDKIQQAYMQGL